MRKLIFIFVFLALISLSCSKSLQEKAKEFVSHICKIISQNITISKLTEASRIYDSLILSDSYKEIINNQDFIIALRNELESCFRSTTLENPFPIKTFNLLPVGNADQYLILDTTNIAVTYLGDESPAFRISLLFRGIKKFEKKILDIDGSIVILDSNKQIIGSYNIHSTPDLISILEKGEGLAQVNTYLAPLWDVFSKNPFELAISSITLMNKSAYFKVFLNIKSENEQKEKVMKKITNTDELLDSLIIKD